MSSSLVSKRQTRMKESFDRFGDGLTEMIVSQLSVEDKFRLQCLSRRVQKVIFKRQTRLIMVSDTDKLKTDDASNTVNILKTKDKDLNKKVKRMVNNIFERLKSLTELELMGKAIDVDYILCLLANNESKVESLKFFNIFSQIFFISKNCNNYFGLKCGEKIKSLEFCAQISQKKITEFLKLTPSLEFIKVQTIDVILYKRLSDGSVGIFSNNKKKNKNFNVMLPMLKVAEVELASEAQLALFHHYYGTTTLNLHYFLTKDQTLNATTVRYFSRVHVLHLTVPKQLDQILSIGLYLLAINGRQLRELYLRIPTINNKILIVLSNFKQLTTLEINNKDNYHSTQQDNLSFYYFKFMTNIKELILNIVHLNDTHLRGIAEYLPRLRSLLLLTNGYISDITMETLSRLQELISLTIIADIKTNEPKTISDVGVIQVMAYCSRIRRLKFLKHYKNCDQLIESYLISVTSIKMFAILAELNPKINYYLTIYFSNCYKSYVQKVIESISLPKNLKFLPQFSLI